VRVAYAQVGLYFHAFSSGTANTVSHAQFVQCGTALQFDAYGPSAAQFYSVRNVLMHTVGKAFYGYRFTGTVEHLTVDGCTTLADTSDPSYPERSILFRNSVFANVTGTSANVSLSGSGNNGFFPSTFTFGTNVKTVTTSPFQTPMVGAGAHYLASSATAFRNNAGSAGIDATLAAELKQLTTYAPVELTGTLANPTTLAPSIVRDTSSNPDLGYHYPALDRIFNNVTVTGVLKLTNGVAIGLRGTQGLQVGPSAQVICEGTPLQMNRVVSCANVQEQPTAMAGNTFMTLTSTTGYPKMDFRFTDWSVGQGRLGTVLSAGNSPFQSLSFRDCWLRAGYLYLYPRTNITVTAALTNNLLERCDLTFGHYYYSQDTPFYVYLYNNLFAQGKLTVNYGSGASNPYWEVHDNLFDNATLDAGSSWDTRTPDIAASENVRFFLKWPARRV
jgi:hypothetical protein